MNGQYGGLTLMTQSFLPHDNPFYLNKVEYEEKPLFWLPNDFSELEGNKPIYIVGSRGVGKTTLLRALNWEDRIYNDSLKESILETGNKPFSKKIIGIYFRLPEYITYGLYGSKSDTEKEAILFSAYLELSSLQLLANALLNLRKEKILTFSVENEIKIVKNIINKYPFIVQYLNKYEEIYSLISLSSAFYKMHNFLRKCSLLSNEPDPYFFANSFGRLLTDIGLIILSLADNLKSIEKWSFKICLDEAECLSKTQQKVINTWSRILKYPISIVVAYANYKWDLFNTFVPELQNTTDDFILMDLDEIYLNKQKYFENLVNGVVNLRLKRIGKNIQKFDSKLVLGDYKINDLFYFLIKNSTRKKLKDLINKAEELYFEFNKSNNQNSNLKIQELPFYQLYLKERLNIELAPKEMRRAQDSAIFRKYMVAALLCFCREYKFEVPYAGYRIINSLSDGCIRDFLRQMYSLYKNSGHDIYNFTKNRIDIKKQRTSIYEASENKFNDTSRVMFSEEVKNLVNSICILLKEIQTNSKYGLSLPERGTIIARSMLQETKEKLYKYLYSAQNAGLVKIISNTDYDIKFTIHRLISPFYGLTYRKPVYEITINTETLIKVIESGNINVLKKRIVDILESHQQELNFL